MVGDPSGGTAQHEEVEESAPSDSNLAYLTMMQQFQERADVKAQAQAKTGESALAAVMQTVMQSQQQMTQLMLQSQQESARQFQTLVTSLLSQQQNKAPDPMLTLVTTLLTQKPKDDNGFTTASVLKMIQDAESRAETRANKIQEQIEKKADSLAEMKVQAMEAGEGEAEESGLKGLIKGFVPVITQMIANNQAAQPTPAQIAQMQEQRRLHGGSSALDQGFIDEQANRPMVGAPRQRPAPRPIVRPVETEVPQSVTSPAVPSGVVVSNPGVSGPVKSEIQSPAQEMVLSSRQKREIFDACAGDIGRALMDRVSASKTAQLIVDKLEKEGLSRQTVAKAYVVEDFYGYAQEYGLPDEVKPWLKEFHESLQKMAGPVVVRESSSAIAPAKVVVANGHLPEKPVPAKRATEARPRARTQPRGHSKDL